MYCYYIMSKGTRRYRKRSRSRGKRRHKKGGNILSRALVPAALYFSQKHLHRSKRGKRKRSRKNRSRKRRGGNMNGGSPLSPASYGPSTGAGNSNIFKGSASMKKKVDVGNGAIGGNIAISGSLGANSKYFD